MSNDTSYRYCCDIHLITTQAIDTVPITLQEDKKNQLKQFVYSTIILNLSFIVMQLTSEKMGQKSNDCMFMYLSTHPKKGKLNKSSLFHNVKLLVLD